MLPGVSLPKTRAWPQAARPLHPPRPPSYSLETRGGGLVELETPDLGWAKPSRAEPSRPRGRPGPTGVGRARCLPAPGLGSPLSDRPDTREVTRRGRSTPAPQPRRPLPGGLATRGPVAAAPRAQAAGRLSRPAPAASSCGRRASAGSGEAPARRRRRHLCYGRAEPNAQAREQNPRPSPVRAALRAPK